MSNATRFVFRWMFLLPLGAMCFCFGGGAWTVYTDPWEYVSEWDFMVQSILIGLMNAPLIFYWLAVRGNIDEE